MKIIAVLSNKGGVGKSTICFNLAVAAELDGKSTAVLDLDPQISLTQIKAVRDKAGARPPAVASIQAAMLKTSIEKLRVAGAACILVDTPPKSEGDILQAARQADLILIPCRPEAMDMAAVGQTIDLVTSAARKPAYVVMSMCRPVGGAGEAAADVIEKHYRDSNARVVPQRICDRSAYRSSIATGNGVIEREPDSKAAEEIRSLYAWVRRCVKM